MDQAATWSGSTTGGWRSSSASTSARCRAWLRTRWRRNGVRYASWSSEVERLGKMAELEVQVKQKEMESALERLKLDQRLESQRLL